MISPHLLFIDAGCALQSRRGSLCIRDVRSGSETLYPARVHGIRTIVLAGYDSNVTSEAMRWCSREAVALYLMERSGECLALLADATECDARRTALSVRQRQFGAVLSPGKRLEVARKIVSVKLRTLKVVPITEAAKSVRRVIGWL